MSIIIYSTEEDFFTDAENEGLIPNKLFFITPNNQLGYAVTNSAYFYLAGSDQNVQFGQVNCSKVVCTGDVELNGVIKIDSVQVVPEP